MGYKSLKDRQKNENTGFGRLLGATWTRLGVSWALLGRLWNALGRLLGTSWVSWAPLERFFGSWEALGDGFGRVLKGVWTSKSAALLAAPGVLKPTAFFACINILHVLTSGGPRLPKWSPKLTYVALCWHIWALCWLFFRSGPSLGPLLGVCCSCWSFF